MIQLQYTPYGFPLSIAAIMAIFIAIIAWRNREAAGAEVFAFMMLALAEWSVSYAFELSSIELSQRMLWHKVKYFGVTTMPILFMIFTIQYTEHSKWLNFKNLASAAIIPVITLLLSLINGFHGLVFKHELINGESFSLLTVHYGPLFWLFAIYSYILLFFSAILIINYFLCSQYVNRGQAIMLLIGLFIPWLGNFLYIFGLNPFPLLDLTPFAFIITGVTIFFSLYGFHFLNIMRIARHTIFENMTDGVIVLDAQKRIVDLNPAARRIAGWLSKDVYRKQISSLFLDQSEEFKQALEEIETRIEAVFFEGGEKHFYEAHLSPLLDQRGELAGQLLMLNDITARKKE